MPWNMLADWQQSPLGKPPNQTLSSQAPAPQEPPNSSNTFSLVFYIPLWRSMGDVAKQVPEQYDTGRPTPQRAFRQAPEAESRTSRYVNAKAGDSSPASHLSAQQLRYTAPVNASGHQGKLYLRFQYTQTCSCNLFADWQMQQ